MKDTEGQPGLLTEEQPTPERKSPPKKEQLPEVKTEAPPMPPVEEPALEVVSEAEDDREIQMVKDLTDQEWAYPIDYEEDGEVYELVFVMKSYLAYDLKLLLGEVKQSYEPHDQRRIGMSSEGSEAYAPFFDKHFIRIEGLLDPAGGDTSHEDQLAWIQENDPQRSIKRGVVRGGVGNVNSIVGGGEGKKKGLVMKLGRSGSVVKTFRILWNPARKEPDKLFVDHHFDKETDKDRRQYDTATGKSEIIRRQQSAFMRSDQNFDAYEQLYDRLANQVKGYTVGGKLCTRENKKDWIRLVPFWEKQFVVDEHFRAVQAKNA